MAKWKKLIVSGSNISQLTNDAGYLTSVTAQTAFVSASIGGVHLIANDKNGQLTFATGSSEINISGSVGNDTLTFSLAGGVISGITDITEKDGTWAKENDFDKTANVLSMVGSGLDAVGTVIPILEPLGLLTSAVGGITGLIGDVIDNTKTHTTNQEALTQGHQDTINQGARASTLTTSGATQKMAQNRQGQASF